MKRKQIDRPLFFYLIEATELKKEEKKKKP